jgi:hypothetical protein
MKVVNINVIIAKIFVLTIYLIWIKYFICLIGINNENVKYDLRLNSNVINDYWIIVAQVITLISIIKQTNYLLTYYQVLIDKIDRLNEIKNLS